MSKDIFLKPYDPSEHESDIYRRWEESGYFNPDNLPGERTESFTITLPPPNVTGILHLGHAYEDSLQDSLIRYHRMKGERALWVPGTDSAAIATQAKVEKDIKKEEGKSRHDLGREELVRRVGEFAKSSEDTILNQVKRVGASLDWSRYAYTLDDARNKAVTTAFVRMYEAGLIYRGNRIINWDPKGQTTISDDEIVHEERKATLYTFRYSKDFPIAISTTRPETKVGDVAVAVHPDDERYKKYIGKEYDALFCDVPIHITIVADKEVDPEFGTGALGVTPAHSHVDWDIAERHNLPRDKQVINEYAKMMVDGRLNNMKIADARESVVAWLRDEDLLEHEEEIDQNISTADRTGAIVEPLPKLQWFVDVDKSFTIPHSEIPGIESGSETTLKDIMRIAVESGAISMPQEGFRKAYFHWIKNLRDWCISRQIWFGHRIPVWYRDDETYVSTQAPTGDGPAYLPAGPLRRSSSEASRQAPEASAGTWQQDPDVLDTWFSSALWTFSTLGWPASAETATAGKPGPENDLANYHPTSFMSPAYEILNLWVSRMILMSGFHLGQVPFKTVLIHGLVRDSQGRKFSKSLGNGTDPIEMIDTYGADALRMGLLVGAAVGSDISFDESKVKGYKHFANKVWNVARFVLEYEEHIPTEKPTDFSETDKNDLAELDETVRDVTRHLDEYRVDLAADRIYHYIWHSFADRIIEESKDALKGDDERAKQRAAWKLHAILATSLKLLHPFMPFITERIWMELPHADSDMLMIAPWPRSKS